MSVDQPGPETDAPGGDPSRVAAAPAVDPIQPVVGETDGGGGEGPVEGPAAVEDSAAPEAPLARQNRVLKLVCLVLFLLTVALAVVAALASSRLHRERSDRRAVLDVSGRFATALLTYDYRHLEDAKKRVLALSVGKFRDEYQQAYSGGLDVLLQQTKATSEVTVTHLYVSEVSGDHAEAVVVVNQTATGASGKRPSIDQYVQLDLVRAGRSWKVDNVTNLTDTAASGPAGTGSSSTTTTTAAKPSK